MAPTSEQDNRPAASDSRRERGKLAQREYRKRHANRFQSLQAENQKLRDAIRDLSRISSRYDNLPQLLKDTIDEARQVAGIQRSENQTNQLENPDDPIDTIEVPQPAELVPFTAKQAPVKHVNAFRSENASYGPGRFSPPLGESLWLDSDRIARLFDVPSDAAPYLGEGMFTLAACLYWASVNYTVHLWQEFNQPGAIFRTDRNRLDRLYNHSRYLNDHEFLVALAKARLGHKQKQLAGDRESWEPRTREQATQRSLLSPLYLKVKQEYEERGERIDWWKNPQEVEDYMRKHMSAKDCADLQAVVGGRGSRAAAIKFAPLVESLAETYVCFGDSPRWNAVQVSMTIGTWLRNKSLQEMVI